LVPSYGFNPTHSREFDNMPLILLPIFVFNRCATGTVSQGVPTILLPLGLVLLATIIREVQGSSSSSSST
jgi:hypothetical protein